MTLRRSIASRRQGVESISARGPRLVVLACAALVVAVLADLALHAEEQPPAAAKQVPATAKKSTPPLVAPEGWSADHPLPQVNSNCARCHLTAGRELTAAVRDFAHSVHDLNAMSCYDCHGGNSDDDVTAHTEEHHFIGTKLSAHLAKCADCHSEQAELLAKSPHHWDWSERINTNYPMCIDCHGNHDVGNPPADFKLSDVCLDCHDDLADEQPALAAVVDHNDRLWVVLAQVRKQRIGQDQPVPGEWAEEIAALRNESMKMLHGLGELSAADAQAHCERSAALEKKLDAWLQKNR